MSKPRIYIASSLSNWQRVRNIRDRLTNDGIEITYDWSKWGHRLSDPNEGKKVLKDEDLRKIATEEVRGVQTADTVLVVMPGERGSHFEMAIAWQLKIPIIILTDCETAPRRTSFHYLPGMIRTDDEGEAIRVAEKCARIQQKVRTKI